MPTDAVVDTSDVAPADRADYWHSHVCDSFVPLRVTPAQREIDGRIAGCSLGETRIRRIRATGHEFERRPADIRRGDPEVLHLVVLNRGATRVEQDGRQAVMRPGDVLFYDSSRPFRFTTPEPFDYTIALVPKQLLPVPEQAVRAGTARALSGRDGMVAVARDLVRAIARHGLGDDSGHRLAMEQSLVGFLTALLPAEPPRLPGVSALREAAQAVIEHRLADTELCPATVAAACSISVSYLHRIFAQDGWTVAGYIRERRLQAAYRDLANPAQGTLSIAAVGQRHGLTDPSHFNRLFKARFDLPPGELRRLSTSLTTVEPSSRAG
ncbi:MAG: helix-turn-helix domain-containing protein [Nocardioides sp.]|uniref:AraC-like ligand-binding domain-containing protein n=1 Tax=Nocardioides sp. TaxID=35761 RepID=UPI0039E70867